MAAKLAELPIVYSIDSEFEAGKIPLTVGTC
jgi:hypothetical protein